MALSQGQRSSSVKGWPALILAPLLGGGNASASSKRHEMRAASISPIVVLPEPETPITMSAHGEKLVATKSLRKRRLIDKKDRLAARLRTGGGKILAAEHARQDRAFGCP